MKTRIKQFYINLRDKMTNEDYVYVKSKLSQKEYDLFIRLLKSEQKHCVRIAKEIEKLFESKKIENPLILKNKELLIKVSLLHDIGKIKQRVSIFDKSIIVILNKITKGSIKKLKNKKTQCYYNHPEYSHNILKNICNDELLLDIIKNHHKKDANNDLILFFQKIDDNN